MTLCTISSPDELLAQLDPDALRAIVARVVQAPALEEMNCHFHRSLQGARGYNGMTGLLSVQYRRSAACIGWVDLALKWPSRPLGESRLYPILMAQDAPVPRMEDVLPLRQVPEGMAAEVMVFEFLPHIGYEEGERLALATTLGRFHALRPELFPMLPRADYRADIPAWITLWGDIQRHGLAGDLGEAIRDLCQRERGIWNDFGAFVESAVHAAEGLPQGVVHRDVSVQNTGWRHDRRELLLFDVPQMAIGSLAQDALALFPDDQSFDPALANRYLETLREHGGLDASAGTITAAIRPKTPKRAACPKKIAFLVPIAIFRPSRRARAYPRPSPNRRFTKPASSRDSGTARARVSPK